MTHGSRYRLRTHRALVVLTMPAKPESLTDAFVIEPQYGSAESFSAGLAKVRVEPADGSTTAYIDTTGAVVWAEP